MVPHRSCFISLLLSFLEGQSGVRFNILMVYTSLYQYFKCNMALWPWNFVLIYLKRNLVLESQGPLNWLMQKFSNISGYWRIFNNFRLRFFTAILHRGLRNDFFSLRSFTFSIFFYFYFPFLFRLVFPFFIWTPISLFFFGLLFPIIFLFPIFLWTFFFSFLFGLLFNRGHILVFFQIFFTFILRTVNL